MAESGVAVILSDRMAGESLVGVVTGSALSGGGPTTFNMTLPAGFGDVLLLDAMITITTIATLSTTLGNMGALFAINSADGSRRQIVGMGKLFQNFDVQVSASPEKTVLPILWRDGESLFVAVPEVDTNVSPTAVWNVWARVVRTRQDAPHNQRVLGMPSVGPG